MSEAPFWTRPLSTLSPDEWEALCDGCGRCCLHKLEDEDDGRRYLTNVACRLLDLKTCRCGNYAQRQRYVPDCVSLTADTVASFDWLPPTCAYRLRAQGDPLPSWHPLINGRQGSVHAVGVSVRGWAVSEDDVDDPEDHIIGPL